MVIVICVLRKYLTLLSGYHVLTGLVSFFSPAFALSFYKALYAVDPVEKRHLHIILRPWGALGLSAGIAGLFAATDPQRYEGVIVALLVLLVLRVAYRIHLRNELRTISGIPSVRNYLNVALLVAGILILGVGLWALRTGRAGGL